MRHLTVSNAILLERLLARTEGDERTIRRGAEPLIKELDSAATTIVLEESTP